MPRIYKDKELNDMRRIIDIYLDHDEATQERMMSFINGSVKYQMKKKREAEQLIPVS